jgi:hypothetical protein
MIDELYKLKTKVVAHFGSDDWLYIKHPLLGYKCPIKYIEETASLTVITELFEMEKMF